MSELSNQPTVSLDPGELSERLRRLRARLSELRGRL
jgi:hypothetical protein